MDKDNKDSFKTNWYELWMQQSKQFFSSAEKNLKEIFGNGSIANPEKHYKEIQEWLDGMKHQWEMTQLTKEQKTYQEYWKLMTKMCSEASDMMLQEWIKRSHEARPVRNVHELYELWLECCHDIYQKSLQTKAYQNAYINFMNAALDLWKTAIPK